MTEQKIKLSGIMAEGYGVIPKALMRSKEIGVYEKTILAYMLSYTGGGSECFPSYNTMLEDLGISRDRLAKSLKILQEKNYINVRKTQSKYDKIYKQRNIYELIFLNDKKIPVPDKGSTPDRLEVVRETDRGSTSDGLGVVRETDSNNNITNNNNNKSKRIKFSPPTIQELKEYIKEKSLNNIDPEYFMDYYESNGWMVGKNKMKDWKATLRNWSRRENKSRKTEKVQEPKIIPPEKL